jgi:hypothetical protein
MTLGLHQETSIQHKLGAVFGRSLSRVLRSYCLNRLQSSKGMFSFFLDLAYSLQVYSPRLTPFSVQSYKPPFCVSQACSARFVCRKGPDARRTHAFPTVVKVVYVLEHFAAAAEGRDDAIECRWEERVYHPEDVACFAGSERTLLPSFVVCGEAEDLATCFAVEACDQVVECSARLTKVDSPNEAHVLGDIKQEFGW